MPKTAFCSTFVPLCLFLSEIDRERCCKTGTCFSLCSLEGVGIPINYVYDNDAQKIYFHGARAGHKVDALRACDKVCFTVYGNETIKEEDWAPFVQSVVVFGRCHLVESGARATTLLKRFAMKYYPSEQLVDEEIAHAGKAVQIFEIEVEYLSGKEIQER